MIERVRQNVTYQKDLGIDTRIDYNRFGFEMRRELGSIPTFPNGTDFDATADESERFGNDIRRSDHLIPLGTWDKLYRYPNSQQMMEFIRRSETNGLKPALSRSPVTDEIVIHEGRFIRWWEKRRNAK